MDDLEFYSPTRLVFGRCAKHKAGNLVHKYGGTKAFPAILKGAAGL